MGAVGMLRMFRAGRFCGDEWLSYTLMMSVGRACAPPVCRTPPRRAPSTRNLRTVHSFVGKQRVLGSVPLERSGTHRSTFVTTAEGAGGQPDDSAFERHPYAFIPLLTHQMLTAKLWAQHWTNNTGSFFSSRNTLDLRLQKSV